MKCQEKKVISKKKRRIMILRHGGNFFLSNSTSIYGLNTKDSKNIHKCELH